MAPLLSSGTVVRRRRVSRVAAMNILETREEAGRVLAFVEYTAQRGAEHRIGKVSKQIEIDSGNINEA
jgi:hypothetical protein